MKIKTAQKKDHKFFSDTHHIADFQTTKIRQNILSITSKDRPNVKNPAFLEGKAGFVLTESRLGLGHHFVELFLLHDLHEVLTLDVEVERDGRRHEDGAPYGRSSP